MKIARIPPTKASQLDELDSRECMEGYWDGKAGEPEPGDNRSYSFWVGWRNGAMDGRHLRPDIASQNLAKDAIESGWLKLFVKKGGQ